MTTQIVAKPAGMVTEPNKVGQFPPGAFADCLNVAIRSFGVMEQVCKFANVTGNVFSGPLVGGVYAVSEGALTVILYEHTTAGTWAVFACVASPSGSIVSSNRAVGTPWNGYITGDARTGVVLMRNRLIVSGTVRSFAFDIYPVPGSGVSISNPRDCGVYQSVVGGRSSSTSVADDPAYLAANQHLSVTSVARYKFSDGYEIVSPPSVPSDYANLSTTLPQVRSVWTVYTTATTASPSESKIDVYRTRSQSVGYDSINNKYIPVSTGSSFYLSKTADRTTSLQLVSDTTLPSTLGEALLTNVSVGGASALPLPPPPTAKTCAVFRGHAFYANFFDPATFTLLNPYFWGFMNMDTASSAVLLYGIGVRFTSGGQTATSGSPTVTGVLNTTGVKVGQSFNIYRADNGVLVNPGSNVVSFTGSTITGTVNSSYSGSVRIELLDRIEICGQNRAALDSPQNFIAQLFFPGASSIAPIIDAAAVGLEPVTTESPAGVYPNFVPTGGVTFRMRTNAPFTIRATNGANFSPALPEIGDPVLSMPGKQKLNGVAWSENNEPENVPPSNYAFVGTGEIYKIIATRDCLWFFCSDGLFRLSGAGGSVGEEYDWVIDPVDPSIEIANPMCAVAYREYVYALTSRGVISISSEGIVRELSDGRINPSWSMSTVEVALPNRPWEIPYSVIVLGQWPWMAVDAANDEIWVRTNQANAGYLDRIWVYNIKTDTWCIRFPSYSASLPGLGIYNSIAQVVFVVYAGSAQLVGSAEVGNTADYEIATVTFQPLYGGSHGAPYTQKQWQDINLSFHSPQPSNSTALCTLRSQGPAGVSAGTREIPPAMTTGQQMETSRIGFTVPRAWPALSNSIAPYMRITSPSVSGPAIQLQPIKFEGMQISYIDFTEQRVRR